jgi:hypothetical protein
VTARLITPSSAATSAGTARVATCRVAKAQEIVHAACGNRNFTILIISMRRSRAGLWPTRGSSDRPGQCQLPSPGSLKASHGALGYTGSVARRVLNSKTTSLTQSLRSSRAGRSGMTCPPRRRMEKLTVCYLRKKVAPAAQRMPERQSSTGLQLVRTDTLHRFVRKLQGSCRSTYRNHSGPGCRSQRSDRTEACG